MNPCEDCHRPVGVHCCHNCKKDANKCKEYHGCGSCNAWEQGIFTKADRIRAMSDEELKYIARAVIKSEDCPMGETECTDCVFHDLCLRGDYYYYNEEEWLQQPAE